MNNVLIITEYFNIRDNEWDASFPHHSNYTDSLKEIADSFNLELSTPVNKVPTRYADNIWDSNSVFDLMFLCSILEELNNHFILPDLWGPSDHAFLSVYIIIEERFIQEKKLAII